MQEESFGDVLTEISAWESRTSTASWVCGTPSFFIFWAVLDLNFVSAARRTQLDIRGRPFWERKLTAVLKLGHVGQDIRPSSPPNVPTKWSLNGLAKTSLLLMPVYCNLSITEPE